MNVLPAEPAEDPPSLNATESPNPLSERIDTFSASEIVDLIRFEDAKVAVAVGNEQENIARAIEMIAECFHQRGRLIYIGAGTSGRLGVLDASECPPTFNTPPEMVVGIIAGGPTALTRAIEGAEDDSAQAAIDLEACHFSADDILVGIATSGRTPYVIAALEYAKAIGAKTVGLVCNSATPIHSVADVTIAPIVGPEVISGSTRMKAGTATKMVLNMLTTGAMVLLGKTYGNLMVDLRATNAKLRQRSVRIVSRITDLDAEAAGELLQKCDGELKTAIVSSLGRIDAVEARQLLKRADGKLRTALEFVARDR